MEINKIWTDLQVEKIIGKGSYGIVYKCFSEEGGEKEYSAVKVISVPQDDIEIHSMNSEGMTDEQTKAYFKDIIDEFVSEVKILESLKGNKNIMNIFDSRVVEKEDGIGWQIFIKMELLTDFATYISDKKLSEADVINLGLDLCNALSVCKKKNIIHRDIKPENIFVDENGNFKLGDFGVAKQLEKTEASMSRKGTYNYMAPEVLSAKHYDSRADIYSLGIVLYKLLNNNRLPFIDANKQIIMHSERQAAFEKRIRGEKIPPIDKVSDGLNAVVLKACQFRAEDRFKNVEELASALKSLKKGASLKIRLANKITRRTKRIIAAVAVILAVSIIAGSVGNSLNVNPQKTENETSSESKVSETEQTTDQATDRTTEQTTEQTTNRTTDRTTEQTQIFNLSSLLSSMSVPYSGPQSGIYTYYNIDFCAGYNGGFYAVSKTEEIELTNQKCTTDFCIIDDKIYYTVIDSESHSYAEVFEADFTWAECSCWVMNLDGSNQKKLFDFEGSGCVIFADEENIYYESDPEPSIYTCGYGRHIYKYNIAQNKSTIITDNKNQLTAVGATNITYAGNCIYFTYYDDGNKPVYAYDISTDSVKKLDFEARSEYGSPHENTAHSGIYRFSDTDLYIASYSEVKSEDGDGSYYSNEELYRFDTYTGSLHRIEIPYKYFTIVDDSMIDYYNKIILKCYDNIDEPTYKYATVKFEEFNEIDSLDFLKNNDNDIRLNQVDDDTFIYSYSNYVDYYNSEIYVNMIEKGTKKPLLFTLATNSIDKIGINRAFAYVNNNYENAYFSTFYDITKPIKQAQGTTN